MTKYKRPETAQKFDHADFRNSVWEKTGGQCWYCGRQMLPFGRLSRSFTIDHIEPVRYGGSDDFSNLVPACGNCNGQKNHKTLEEYRKWIGGNHIFWFEKMGLVS